MTTHLDYATIKKTIVTGGNDMRRLGLISFVLACLAGAAAAADYPDHAIRLIVPQAAGSATDNAARLLGAV